MSAAAQGFPFWGFSTPRRRAHAAPVAADVSVVHHLQLSLAGAEVAPGTTAEHMEQDKTRASGAGCQAAGWRFSPVCAETTGAWGPGAQRFIRGLVRKQGRRTRVPMAEAAASVWRRLNSAVMKGTAQMLVRAYPEVFGAGGPPTGSFTTASVCLRLPDQRSVAMSSDEAAPRISVAAGPLPSPALRGRGPP